MITDQLEKKHWINMAIRFVTDMGLVCLSFLMALIIRFGPDYWSAGDAYIPGIIFGAFSMAAVIYIAGLYTGRRLPYGHYRRIVLLLAALVVAFVAMIAFFYVTRLSVLGRGVMGIAALLTFSFMWLHHMWLNRPGRFGHERVAMVVGSPEDEIDAFNIVATRRDHSLRLVGIITYEWYVPTRSYRVLGHVKDLVKACREHELDRVICTNRNMTDPRLYRQVSRLRLTGIQVMPEMAVFEEFFQFCPISQISLEWLLHASSSGHYFFITRIKRLFDIVASLIGLFFLGPFALLGAMATKITAPGPALYKQVRLGRFEKPITVYKLRSMRIDAEKDGAQWSSQEGKDPRVTPVGDFIRKYRIDEIPQLINVLKGDMSFVGPRPERPEFTQVLGLHIPLFEERTLVHPGLTGWAQVNYPYGSSIDDARRKLEYDLYYIKHMNLLFDLFIILDTIRIVIMGGATEKAEIKLKPYTLGSPDRAKELDIEMRR